MKREGERRSATQVICEDAPAGNHVGSRREEASVCVCVCRGRAFHSPLRYIQRRYGAQESERERRVRSSGSYCYYMGSDDRRAVACLCVQIRGGLEFPLFQQQQQRASERRPNPESQSSLSFGSPLLPPQKPRSLPLFIEFSFSHPRSLPACDCVVHFSEITRIVINQSLTSANVRTALTHTHTHTYFFISIFFFFMYNTLSYVCVCARAHCSPCKLMNLMRARADEGTRCNKELLPRALSTAKRQKTKKAN